MTDEEQLAAIKYTVDVVNHRVPVIAGAGSNDTDHGCALASKSAECGAELVVSSRRYFLEGDQTTVVAVNDGRCVACASMSYIEIMPTFSHSSGKRAHLMNVYTEEHYRRRGIAKHLVNMLIGDARAHGATEISLDATESGRPLYESVGFKASEECMAIDIQQL